MITLVQRNIKTSTRLFQSLASLVTLLTNLQLKSIKRLVRDDIYNYLPNTPFAFHNPRALLLDSL
jgi:hypothetical protein